MTFADDFPQPPPLVEVTPADFTIVEVGSAAIAGAFLIGTAQGLAKQYPGRWAPANLDDPASVVAEVEAFIDTMDSAVAFARRQLQAVRATTEARAAERVGREMAAGS